MTHESFANGVILILGGGVAWALWRAGKARPQFTVRIIDGRPQVVEGSVTPAFLQRIREVVAAHGIDRGTIHGVADAAAIRLRFSAEIPDSTRQQLRNWWACFGWAPPRAQFTDRVADR